MVALLYLCFDPDVFRKQNRTSRIRTSLEFLAQFEENSKKFLF